MKCHQVTLLVFGGEQKSCENKKEKRNEIRDGVSKRKYLKTFICKTIILKVKRQHTKEKKI
jgi:hypothetical protein